MPMPMPGYDFRFIFLVLITRGLFVLGFAAGAVLGYTALDALALDRTVFGDLVTTAKQEAAAAAKTK